MAYMHSSRVEGGIFREGKITPSIACSGGSGRETTKCFDDERVELDFNLITRSLVYVIFSLLTILGSNQFSVFQRAISGQALNGSLGNRVNDDNVVGLNNHFRI